MKIIDPSANVVTNEEITIGKINNLSNSDNIVSHTNI